MKAKILSLGEVLWDLLPSGPVLGGAPANFAIHAWALGAEASLVTRIGNDPLGSRVLEHFSKDGFPTEFISVDPSAPTGVVSVNVGADGQPGYVIAEDVAWDRLVVDVSSLEEAAGVDAVCFGSLAQRSSVSRDAIRSLVRATPKVALRIFDVNLRQEYYSPEILESSLELANVLKLNDTELPVLGRLFSLKGGVSEQLAELARRFDLRAVVYTRGGHGSLLWVEGELCEHPGLCSVVRDTVGAGDAFTVAVVLGLLKGWSLEAISQAANEVAAFVCSQVGATPSLPEALRQRFLDSTLEPLVADALK